MTRVGSGTTIPQSVLRITFLLPGPPSVPVGGYRVIYTYANHLAQRGHHVSIVHAGKLGQFKPHEPTSWKTLRKAYRYWSRIKPAIIPPHVSWHAFHPGVKLIFLPSEPTDRVMPLGDIVVASAWTTAEYLLDYKPNKGERFYLIQHLETWQGQEERVLATWASPFHKTMVSCWLYSEGLKRGLDDSIHIPIAVDHELFHPGTALAPRKPSILGMYHPSAWKGGEDLIATTIRLRELYPAVPILLFGVANRPSELPLSIDYVQNPSQTALANLYRTYAIFIHTSHLEGWALPPAEAMASGCVFVGTDSRGNRDYAVGGVNALVVEPGDIDGLVQNVSRVMENSGLQQRLQEEGVKTLSQFQWAQRTEDLEQYFVRYKLGFVKKETQ